MKRETILKTMLVLIIGVMLFALPVNVYAEPTDLDNFWEDQGGLDDIGGDTTTETPEPEQKPTTPSTPSTPTTPEPEETLPEAGIAEDTMMVVTIVALVILAIVAYKKVNEYQNI